MSDFPSSGNENLDFTSICSCFRQSPWSYSRGHIYCPTTLAVNKDLKARSKGLNPLASVTHWFRKRVSGMTDNVVRLVLSCHWLMRPRWNLSCSRFINWPVLWLQAVISITYCIQDLGQRQLSAAKSMHFSSGQWPRGSLSWLVADLMHTYFSSNSEFIDYS